ncbi:hypothetical protein K450DRAFT_255039 [Umbelopsis ramanniana AG]|uniref:Uncharacterized protein n=1 Tax=Umbelopsis ramanniana AG TaxID=1314678 RepID=A0AAD5E4N4_UMBRA|nr:uncharacterized protein K450DRAFT_255039 [Umbelopsis ramanniana AG]KAI8576802.1 hypothetical protein K450DRAFT_255039 [Umbelopsis ramanniana AG]
MQSLLLLLHLSYVLATVQPLAYILELTNIQSFLLEYPELHLRHTFNSSILTGVSVNFHSLDDAHRVLQDPNILQTWPVTLHARPMSNYSINEIPGAAQKLTSQNLAYQQLDTDGSGIRIGVIDSGVDYRHPALGGCFGVNCKVRYGYDLVGDEYNGDIATLKPDPDPMDSCGTGSGATGHGTHISGILAADDKELNWTGVAPGATLGMWRVFSCQNVLTPNDILIKAMEMAYKADMDIVNLSFGENGGWAEDPLAVVADRMVEAGVHVVVASGDSGGNGVFLTAAPATGRKVISTGSIDNRLVAAHVLDIKGHGSIVYRTADNFPIYNQTHHSLVSVSKSLNLSVNACTSLSYNLTNAYVVTKRGDCADYTQAANLQQAGAAAVILVSLQGQDTNIGLISVGIPVVSVPFDNGEQIQHLLRKESRLSARLTTILSTLPVLSGGQVSSLSTLGPTNELELKPEISAVGGYVFSTLPRYLGSYGTMSGTSMSSPWVAGSIALLLGYNKELTPQQVRTALMNYAQPVNTTITNKPMIDSPIRQGAGVADIISTIACVKKLSVNPPKLNLNDTQHFTNTHSLTITNHQDSELTVYISYQNSATVAGYNISNPMDFEPLEPVSFLAMSRLSDYAHIDIASSKIVLPPGHNATLSLDITPPTTNNRFHSFYGGYIVVRTSGCTASVPFIGMSGNMSALPILDRSPSTSFPFPSIGNPNNTILASNETGQYVLNQTFPSVLARLLTGTAIAQIQVLDQHHTTLGDVPLQITTNQTSPNPRAWVVRNLQRTLNGATDFKVWKWDFTYLPVNATVYGQNRQLDKVQTVTPGTYHLKLRTLRVFGNRNNIHDWDQWTSPPLQVKSIPSKHHNHPSKE